MSENNISLGAEDKYSLIKMSSDKMFTPPLTIGKLSDIFQQIKNEWPLVWDFRRNKEEELYNDIKYAFDEARHNYNNNIVLINKDIKEIDPIIKDTASRIIRMENKPFQYFPLYLEQSRIS